MAWLVGDTLRNYIVYKSKEIAKRQKTLSFAQMPKIIRQVIDRDDTKT